VIVYRICQTYPPHHNPIDGMGAYQKGGRWNSKGTFAVYTAGSLALARAELARHINFESIPDAFSVYEIEIPDDGCVSIAPLPIGWDDDPPAPISQRLGDAYLKDTSILGIKVRSACDPASFNYVLNPRALAFAQVNVVRSYAFVP